MLGSERGEAMNSAIYRISLDVHDVSTQIYLSARRWETGRTIQATLTENGRPYVISEGCSAEIVFRRPNGNTLKNPCVISGNVISYELTMLTTATVGVLACEIRLMDATGKLLTSPQFCLEVYATIYNYGDATESEIASANTVKSANPAYAEVFMWSDGNGGGEDRVGYFVCADTSRDAAMVRKAESMQNLIGISMSAPGYAANAPGERYDDNSSLRKQYCYVGMMGLVPVIDNGQCHVNGYCCPGAGGIAIPSTAGFLVVERLDENHVLTLLKKGGGSSVSVVLGPKAPSAGPVLWLNTDPRGTGAEVIQVALDQDISGHTVIAQVDGTAYGMENFTANQGPAPGKYDFTVK